MLSRPFVIVVVLVALPALSQVPYAPDPALANALAHITQDSTMRFQRVRADGSVSSSNWSGYAALGTSFTYAKGSWTVTALSCAKTPNSYAVFWVGLDGYSSSTVEQIGTIAFCNGSTAEYGAWWEFYPAKPIEVISSFVANPGNKIFTEVSYAGTTFTLKITNETTGKSFTKTGTSSSAKRNSAEWIAEAPTVNGAIAPLSDFGAISWGDDYTKIADTNWASDSAVTGPISDFGDNVREIVMEDGGGVIDAQPSALTTDGSSFKVAWKSE